MGNYHGFYSFKAFSHQRTIAKVPAWADALLRVRYMPYEPKELAFFLKMAPKPSFDRNGNTIKGVTYWLGMLFRLGGGSVKGGAFRWGLLFAVLSYMGVKKEHVGM